MVTLETLEEYIKGENFPVGVDGKQTLELAIWALKTIPIIEFYAHGRQEGSISGVEWDSKTGSDVPLGHKARIIEQQIPMLI